jgi:hypothetical protein
LVFSVTLKLRSGCPSDQTPPSWAYVVHASFSLCLPRLSLKNIYPLACPLHALRRCAAVRPPHSAFATIAILPHAPHPVMFASHSCPSCAPTHASCSLLLQSHLRRRARRPPLLVLVVPSRALDLSLAEPRAPMSAARAGGACTPRLESTGLTFPPICCKCMFQVDVLKVCCRCFVWLLQK